MDAFRADGSVNSVSLFLPSYTQFYTHFDPDSKALWYYFHPKLRPCATPTVLAEMRDLYDRLSKHLKKRPEDINYLVMTSATPDVFGLGGDLELFTNLVEGRDRDALYTYGRDCVELVYSNATNFGIPTLTTIALVQGAALGGGFEGALSNNVVIAEENAQMGFPEILFNLFPGMGAFNLLVRRIEPWRAERLLRTARQYPARELWEIGVVDQIAPNGEGVHAVNDFIRRRRYVRNGHQAIQQARQRINPLTLDELIGVVEIWVDTAMRLTPRDLRVMKRIAAAQQPRIAVDEPAAKAPAAVQEPLVAPAALRQ